MTYDHAGRLLTIRKSVNGETEKLTVQNSYDDLGQLKKKELGKKADNSFLETLDYAYNIRGWLNSVNKDFATASGTNADNRYFGMQLSYDYGFTQNQLSGNISGMKWRSKGDGEQRAYGFDYDNVNRLLKADFNQNNSGWNTNAGIDFSVSNLSYDANGNIGNMTQKGWKLTGSSVIDQLTYGYVSNSNRLNSVTDPTYNDYSSKLGDFKYDPATKGSTDYGYDVNGNMVSDANKKISSIAYNYLNLPGTITIIGKGSIDYVYDAAGNKLKKVVHETGKSDKTTLYLFGTYENDVLQFLPQEEGRIRPLRDGSGTITSFAYDYFLKDHLGNVRTVLTDEQQTAYYPAATLEGSQTSGALSMVNYEKQFYTIDNTRITSTASIPNWSSGLNYQNNNGNPPSNSIASGSYPSNYTVNDGSTSTNMYKTNAGSNKTGLGAVIKVMAGDKVDIFGKSYYYAPGGSFSNSNSAALVVTDILNAFLGTPGNAAASKGLSASNLNNLNSGSYALPSNLIRGTDGTTSSLPKAYINYIFFDEQFRYAGSGFSRVGNSGTVKSHWYEDASLQNVSVPKNGYLYVYASNESNTDVYFDNLQIIHNKGPLVEETHYYPFGLTMAGISSKAANTTENKKKYNGIELENDLEIQTYDAFFRELDPQTARWWQIDPVTDGYEDISPYASMYDNPMKYSDPLGDEGESCCWDKIKEAANYVGGAVMGAVVGGIDNVTGSNLRGAVSSSFEGTGAAGNGWNMGLNVADAGGVVLGIAEIGTGAAGVIGAGAGTLLTAGVASPVTVPIGAGSVALATHGVFTVSNSANNLVNQNGRVNAGSNNPYGSKGKPDHQQKVDDLAKKAQKETKPGETVVRERKIQGQDSRRKPDVQIVDRNGKARKVFEAERKPTSQRNLKREQEYRKLKVDQETHPVGNK
jgi:RHS repeat-associated protein